MVQVTFRDALANVTPPWLRRWWASRILYSIVVMFDLLVDACVAGVRARFPGTPGHALAMIGAERRMRRGGSEPAVVYASRLRGWLDAHRRRGSAYALLGQLHAFWQGGFVIWLVYASGTRYTLATDGTITRDTVAWSIPDASTKWARWWLFFHWPEPVDIDGTWDDPGFYDDGGVWDVELTPEEVEEVLVVPREWNAAHANGTVVLLRDGDDPTDAFIEESPLVLLPVR